ADVPAPEMPMLQPATTVAPAITPANTTVEAPASVTAQTEAPTSSNTNTGSLPTTGASLLLTPALILIGVGAAARRAAARRR
ncbi:MAG: hypothetical protein EBS20_09630, partial [Actinobacteria bacterium]|nr:hypothetical protein [Actinomycetota bacterium]